MIGSELTLVRALVERTRSAARGWAALSIASRAAILADFRRALVAHADELSATITAETQKPRLEALAQEILIVANLFAYYEKHAAHLLRERSLSTGIMLTKRARKCYLPYGVVGIIGPWNYPLSLPAIPMVCALFAGNGVLIKPSELTPRTAALLVQIGRAALGTHADVLALVEGGPATGAALVDAPCDKLCFIGSEATAKRIAAAAAPHLTPLVLELGANDVAIVCEDADIERTAKGVVWGAFMNAGQACVSIERVLVADAIADQFRAALIAEAAKARSGPLIHAAHAAAVGAILDDALAKGARIVHGGSRQGAVLAPTILEGVPADARLHVEETFGPLLPIVRVHSDAEAVALANASPYGLAATVWTQSPERGRSIAAGLEVGTVVINDAHIGFAIPALAYGGVRRSGYGRLMGEEGLLEFVRTKGIIETIFPLAQEPYWYPYFGFAYGLAKKALTLLFGR